MEWLEALHGSVVGLDTAPLIYLIEENPAYLPFVRPFFESVNRGELRVVTSFVTLGEVLVHPMRQGNRELADEYRRILLQAKHVTTLPVSEDDCRASGSATRQTCLPNARCNPTGDRDGCRSYFLSHQ